MGYVQFAPYKAEIFSYGTPTTPRIGKFQILALQWVMCFSWVA